MMKYTALIFDLDGTITDSKGDLEYSLQRAFADYALPFDSQKLVIGPPIQEIVYKLVPGINNELYIQVVARFRQYYNNSNFERTTLYPYAQFFIEKCKTKGCQLFIATNKPQSSTKLVIEQLELTPYFTAVMCPDSLENKTLVKADMVAYSLEKYHLENIKTIMIGDSISDINAGQKAGIDTAAHLNGYEDANTLKSVNPTYTFESFKDLSDQLKI